MQKKLILPCSALLIIMIMAACSPTMTEEQKENQYSGTIPEVEALNPVSIDFVKERVLIYAPFELITDISHLTEKEKQILPILFDVADIMGYIYWQQTIGNKEAYFSRIDNEATVDFSNINYGPWDRLNNNTSFIAEIGPKPAGANFYPADMTKEEFEAFDDSLKTNLYTLIRRNEDSSLRTVWYHEAYASKVKKAADLLKKAADLAENEGLKKYLTLRAEALLTDDYQPSDFAWLEMKTSKIDFVVGPIENYEDALYGYKAAQEAFILIKDPEWSERLTKYASLLPGLQKGIPVEEEYKSEVPGSNTDLNVYDVIYYAGDCNAGSKTIAINLPNDEEVQLKAGSRKLQLKNAMRAKFDRILVPISEVLIDPAQRQHITFDAFFGNTMFHEVAHGLGIKNTLDGEGTVRKALKEQYSAIEEGKADIMGLYLVTQLFEMGEITEGEIMDNYVTFFAGIFRSSRFGAASAHGKANMMRFNYFEEKEAFTRNDDGTYTVDFDKMHDAMIALMLDILHVQGNGDYDQAKTWVKEKGLIMPQLQADLDLLNASGIPVDIVFHQGKEIMNLK